VNYKVAHNKAMELLGHSQWDIGEVQSGSTVVKYFDEEVGEWLEKIVPDWAADDKAFQRVPRPK
jgi:hypothetical protein